LRILTALVLIPAIVCTVLWAPQWLFLLVVSFIAAMCFREFAGIAAAHGLRVPLPVGLAAGMILSEDFRRFGQLAQLGAGLLFLKFSRADEAEADRLGFKYMVAGGYDPRALVEVFRMLDRIAEQGGGAGRLPQWLSTHPSPENRQGWAARMAGTFTQDPSRLTVNRKAYLQRVDGMVFGENPREGVFQGTTFRHPDLAFRIDFPAGWTVVNQKRVVGAVSPQQDAVVVLQLAPASTASQAARQFLGQSGVEPGEAWTRQIGRLPAVSATFRVASEQRSLRGLAAWVDYRDRVWEMVGYTSEARWFQYDRLMAQAIASYDRETDPAVLSLQPNRLSLVEVSRPATFDALMREFPSVVPPQTVAIINNLETASTVPAGSEFKRVVGGQTP
jgi:predicted Zn-dependent protease